MPTRDPSKFRSDRTVDNPLTQDANYRFDPGERQYIDDQIRALQEWAVEEAIPALEESVAVPDADASTKGRIQLAGDLGGTGTSAATPTVSGITGASGVATIAATHIQSTGNARLQPHSHVANVQTTDATVTSLFTWTIPDEAVSLVTAEILAIKSDGSTCAAYVVRARIKRDGGTVTVGTPEITLETEDSLNGTVTIDNSTSTGRIRVTGIAATTIDWGCVVTRLEMTHA